MASSRLRPRDIFPAVDGSIVAVHVLRPRGDSRWWLHWTGEQFGLRTLAQDPDDDRPTIAPLDVASLDYAAPGMEFQSCDADWPDRDAIAFARALLGLHRFLRGAT